MPCRSLPGNNGDDRWYPCKVKWAETLGHKEEQHVKRSIVKSLCLAAVMVATSLPGWAEGPRILLYIRDWSAATDFMLSNEVGVMTNLLEDAGLQVVCFPPALISEISANRPG